MAGSLSTPGAQRRLFFCGTSSLSNGCFSMKKCYTKARWYFNRLIVTEFQVFGQCFHTTGLTVSFFFCRKYFKITFCPKNSAFTMPSIIWKDEEIEVPTMFSRIHSMVQLNHSHVDIAKVLNSSVLDVHKIIQNEQVYIYIAEDGRQSIGSIAIYKACSRTPPGRKLVQIQLKVKLFLF